MAAGAWGAGIKDFMISVLRFVFSPLTFIYQQRRGLGRFLLFALRVVVFPLAFVWALGVARRHEHADPRGRIKVGAAAVVGILLAAGVAVYWYGYQEDARDSMYGEADKRIAVAVGENAYQGRMDAVAAAEGQLEVLRANLAIAEDEGQEENATAFVASIQPILYIRAEAQAHADQLSENHMFYQDLQETVQGQNDAAAKQAISSQRSELAPPETLPVSLPLLQEVGDAGLTLDSDDFAVIGSSLQENGTLIICAGAGGCDGRSDALDILMMPLADQRPAGAVLMEDGAGVGLETSQPAGVLAFVDDDGDGEFTSQDTLYFDADADGAITTGDVALSGSDAGTVVTSGDSPPLTAIPLNSAIPIGVVDSDASGDLSIADELVLDLDEDGRFGMGDVLLGASGFGTVRDSVSFDTGIWDPERMERRSDRAFEIKDKAEDDMQAIMVWLLFPGAIGALFGPLFIALGSVLANDFEGSETVGYKKYPGASLGLFLILGGFGWPSIIFSAWGLWDIHERETTGQIAL